MKLEKHIRQAAIEWFSDRTWIEDVDSDYFNDLTDAEIIKGLNRHWGGGYEDFVHSCNWTGPYETKTTFKD